MTYTQIINKERIEEISAKFETWQKEQGIRLDPVIEPLENGLFRLSFVVFEEDKTNIIE